MYLRRKLVAATALMLVCAILLVSASFAWLSISSAPEISGVDTNIGSNGSLEIALLSGLTYPDPDQIRTGIGDSLEVEDRGIANETWGNVIELSEGYGLDEISLRPARLNVMLDGDGNHVVGSNLLVYPRYGEDGRSSDFYQNSVSATYVTDKFAYFLQDQDYGVRAIGTVSKLSAQQTALGNARSRVKSYTQSALRTATSAWAATGEAYLDLYIRHYYLSTDEYHAEDIGTIRSMAAQMRTAINYIDLALRQGVVGFAASMIGDEDAFRSVRAGLENQLVPLHDTLTRYSEYFEIPGEFSSWASVIQGDLEALNRVVKDCDLWLSEGGSEPAWGDIEWMLRDLMNADKVYWNGDLLPEMSVIAPDNVLTLTPDAGPVSHIAEFAGDYSAFFSYIDEASIEVKTLSAEDVPHLAQVSGTLELLSAASGSDELESVPLEDIYGFSVDLAFRCNRLANLLLQTAPAARVEGDDLNQENQGSGSYMEFYSDQLSGEQVSKMMGAIRVGFLDDRNHLVALAKCGTEFDVSGDSAKAYLYLHEFTVKADGSISVGDPRELDSAIKTLDDGVPAVLTVVVWLDGDYVDNSMAAISGSTMSGKLNLQFAADRELNPAPGSTTMSPDSGGNDEPTPDTPTEQTEFYLEHDGGDQYSFYTLNADGSREYEMTFSGSVNEEAQTVTVEDVTEYPDGGVVIPALATYTADSKEYSVSIDPTDPFAYLGTKSACVSFVPVDGEKVGITSTVLSDMFNRSSGTDFVSLDLSGLDTSTATDMSYMFGWLGSLAELDISGFDTSNVTDMTWMFNSCSGLTELDVSGFDTSNVTSMSLMFAGCSGLTELDVSGFDTSNVTSMFIMFNGCSGLTELDVSGFDTSNLPNMSHMFNGCSGLTELDVSGFDTSNATDMSSMFNGCSGLTVLDVSGFDTSNVTDMSSMFNGCSGLTELDLSGFDTTNVTNTDSMLDECSGLENIVTPKAMGNVAIFLPASYLCEANGNTYTAIDSTVPAKSVLTKGTGASTDDGDTYYVSETGSGEYTIYTLAGDGSRDYELNFTGSMNAEAQTIVVEEVTSYPAGGVIIPALATYSANGAEYAVSIDPTAPFANLGTTSASVSFAAVDGEKVGITSTVLSDMFDRNEGTDFVSLDLSGLDTSNVTDMSQMFYDCKSLTSLGLSDFDTSNVTSMRSMFEGCSGLTELDASVFDTSSVIDMYSMFYGCSGLTALDVSNFDTSNVTNMSAMFKNCSSLTELDVSDFDTAEVTGTANMFNNCSSLTELDVSGFDTSNVTTMYAMFSGCSSLTELDVSNFDTAKVVFMNAMFLNCSSLMSLNLSNFDPPTITINTVNMLAGCSELQTIVTPKTMGKVSIDLPASYVCEANGNTYTVIDQTVPAQAVLVKK